MDAQIGLDWIQVFTIVGTNIALTIGSIGLTVTLFLWSRSESRSDWRHMDMKLETFKEEMRTDMKQFRELWMQESKEFHQRLCDIEAKRK